MTSADTTKPGRRPFLPPRWFIRLAWVTHRAAYRLTGGRRGLWIPKGDGWGTLLLTSVGRRSGRSREAILGYIEDGPNLVTLAMNGWGAAEPAWWLNLQAHPEATIQLKGRTMSVRARAAVGEERDRLWARWDVEGYADLRPNGTAVVVLEPRLSDDEPSRDDAVNA
jgi:F420H(2)-dependent quinone reductase